MTSIFRSAFFLSWFVVALFCFCLGTGAAFTFARPTNSGVPPSSHANPSKRVKLAIGGMDCKGCESGIAGELKRTPGVIAAEVSYERQEAVVDYDPAKITTAGIIAAIKGAGFTAKVKKN